MRFLASFSLFLLLSSCVEIGAPEPSAEGEFTPVLAQSVEYSVQHGHYVRVGRWVFVALDVEFRNVAPGQALDGVEIVPPFAPADEQYGWTGQVSGYYSDLVPGVMAAELTLDADPSASVLVRLNSQYPGATPLLLGEGETLRVVGQIAYTTDGDFLY
jgi:hypothetical protein